MALAKFFVAGITGSSAMPSEGVHSLVNTGNEMLLLYGVRRSRRRVDEWHPFGYGKTAYLWSLIVALSVFPSLWRRPPPSPRLEGATARGARHVRQRSDRSARAWKTPATLAIRAYWRIAMTESTESFINAKAAGYTWERRSVQPEDEHLLGKTINWLNALPEGVRPVHLQQDFPRIANELALLWAKPQALDLYFEEKEFSTRPDRSGFQPLIKEELLAMHAYALRHRPEPYEARTFPRGSLLR